MSFAQQRLWYLEQLEPGDPAYHVVHAVRLKGRLDQQALHNALNKVVERHEALRTTFGFADSMPVQAVQPARPVELRCFDLREDSPGAPLAGLLRAEARRPFDFSQDLMLRAVLARLADEEHVLLLTVHHIAVDGWSLGVLRCEMAVCYEAYSAAREPALPELPIQYADHSIWQAEHVKTARIERQLEYWKQQLASAPAALDLPADRPRPARRTHDGATEFFELPRGLHFRVKQFCAAENVSLYMVLMAAFQALLHRYSGQQDICVGSPIAGRTRRETEGLIGYFVNTLAIRGDLSGTPSFRELVQRLRKVSLDAYSNHEVPFDKVVEALRPERGGDATLFQTMLILQNSPSVDLNLPSIEASPFDLDTGVAKFDLSLAFRERETGLGGYLEYSTDLFDAATARRIIGHFETLLDAAIDAPDQAISSLPLLTAGERQQVLLDWNNTAEDVTERCVHEFFEEHAQRAPAALAVAFEDQQLTYGELNQRADRLARRLCELGVGPGTLVGLYAERSLDLVVGLVGALKAGAAYIPLDPAYPQERLALMAEDAGLKVLLTQSHLLARLPAAAAQAVALDTLDWTGPPSATPLPAVSPSDLVYVVYTSGSTGKPKGVAIEHRSLVNLLKSFGREVTFSHRDHLFATSSMSFDMGNLDVFLPLFYGAAFTIASRDVAIDADRLGEAIDDAGATYMQATPATFRLLLDSGWQGKKDLKILSGGENLTRSLVDRLDGKCRAIWNGYGPAEATMCSVITRVNAGDGAVPIGKPLANTLAYAVDSQMQPVPAGVRGELCIGGIGLAREYLNRPELTAERFIANPFGPGRLYKTGDLVRWWADGQLEFLGRSDDQVKVRGFRIELGEIEAALLSHAAVNAACVMVREDIPGDRYLASYYIAEPGRGVSNKELREYLRKLLPAHMVPGRWLQVDRLPLTPNGKVDRRALPAPPAQLDATEQNALLTEMQKHVAQVWENALGLQGVGVHDNFYDLGGHSLLSMQVIQALEAGTGVRMQPTALVSQSLGQIAAFYERNKKVQGNESRETWMQRLARGAMAYFRFRVPARS